MQIKTRSMYMLIAVLLVASFVLAACQPAATPVPTEVVAPPTDVPAPTEVPTPEPTPEPAIGSPEHPIKVLFVPSVDANVIVSGGQMMADALNQATGMTFEVSVPTSYAATIEEMCASPADTMGFIPALGYVFANELCGVDVAFKAVRRGWDVYWAQFLVARDSDIQTIEDLDGKKWGYTDAGSTSGYMFPLAMLKEAGVEPSESIATGGHPQAVKAVYNGEVDFATTFFSPFAVPEGVDKWKRGDAPDMPDEVIENCKINDEGKNIVCDGYVLLDARNNIREEAPDVVQKVRIMTLSPDIPNDTLSFGPDFPADTRATIEAALVAFAATDAWKESIGSEDFYGWSGLSPALDADYDFVRSMVEANGITFEDLGQ
ncbi:MAG: phosphate/phosphite/phosphonate ABC transporter substrate-binding protein [Bellilinea sp.]